jgi:hypothetical protein
VEGGAALPAAPAPAAAFLGRPGLATAAAVKFRRGEAGDAVLPPRPFTAGLPTFTPVAVATTAGGDVLSGVCCGCLLSALAEALEGVRVRGVAAAAVGFLARLAAAAAGGVRPAEGSLAEN